MTDNQHKAMRTAIREHFAALMPAHIEKLARLCHWDLHFGPLVDCDECGSSMRECLCAVKWPGFETASGEVSTWAKENVFRLWYDADGDYISESEPDTTYECGTCAGDGCEDCAGRGSLPEYLDETYQLERREVLALLFDKELVNYI